MKIFLTGGTGFVGSHFINAAHAGGHRILALRRPDSLGPRAPLDVEPDWIMGGYADLGPSAFNGVEAFVHLAAHSANVPYDSLENCMKQNVTEPLKLVQTAVAAGVRRFIIAGSCFEYGKAGERYEFIPPLAPLEATASYPASKAAASIALSALGREMQLEMAILRIFQVFGPGELESRFWPTLKKCAMEGRDMPMTTGEQIRDFIPVEDVARVFAAALEWQLTPGAPLFENVGSGRPTSLRQFAEDWWRHWDAKGKLQLGALPMRPNEISRYVPLISPLVEAALAVNKPRTI